MKPKTLTRVRMALFACGLAGIVSAAGCQFSPMTSIPGDSFWPKSLIKKDEPMGLPDRVMPFWTDTVLYQPKQPGIRGFGGRVYFYNDGSEEPVEVDGNLIVYAFDNEALPSEAGKPVKKFVFTADQFATHMSRTNIGASYSLWLPWDEVGGPTKQLSLVTRFEGREGGVVISEPTVKLLPGVNEELGKKPSSEPQGVVQAASFISGQVTNTVKTANVDHLPDDQRQVDQRAMTIDLPPSFQRHLDSGNGATDSKSRGSNHLRLNPKAQPENKGLEMPTSDSTSDPDNVTNEAQPRTTNHYQTRTLRDTFRKPATSKDSLGAANGRPASWLVSPR